MAYREIMLYALSSKTNARVWVDGAIGSRELQKLINMLSLTRDFLAEDEAEAAARKVDLQDQEHLP